MVCTVYQITVIQFLFQYISDCPNDMYSCGDGQCIHKTMVCDYQQHCGDGRDERNCVYSMYQALYINHTLAYVLIYHICIQLSIKNGM